MMPGTRWTAALSLPVVIGTKNVVTNAVGGTQGFCRLSHP